MRGYLSFKIGVIEDLTPPRIAVDGSSLKTYNWVD